MPEYSGCAGAALLTCDLVAREPCRRKSRCHAEGDCGAKFGLCVATDGGGEDTCSRWKSAAQPGRPDEAAKAGAGTCGAKCGWKCWKSAGDGPAGRPAWKASNSGSKRPACGSGDLKAWEALGTEGKQHSAGTHLRGRLPASQTVLLQRPVDGGVLLETLQRVRGPAQSVGHDRGRWGVGGRR